MEHKNFVTAEEVSAETCDVANLSGHFVRSRHATLLSLVSWRDG